MNTKPISKSASQPQTVLFTFWIHKTRKCLSFHYVDEFEQMLFPDQDLMWWDVYHLIDQGFKVQ